ncbi:MAG: TadE family protein [Pirellulaceae bacterium]
MKRQAEIQSRRVGAALVELAVCLPIIVMIVMATIECSSLLFCKQAMVQSAYEAAMVATKSDGTNAKALDAAQRVAQGRRISGIQITFNPPNIDRVASGTVISVSATAPSSANRLITSGIFTSPTVSARAVMVRE